MVITRATENRGTKLDKKAREMTTLSKRIPAALIAIAVAGGAALATATAAYADAGVQDDSVRAASVRATDEEAPTGARGSITFRASATSSASARSFRRPRPRSASWTTRRRPRKARGRACTSSSATRSTRTIRVSSCVAIRGYNFATGTYDRDQAIQLGQSALSIDSSDRSEATHTWGHLNSSTERGIDLDVHGVHFGHPS